MPVSVTSSLHPVSGPPLGIAGLATVLSELFPCCAKWYNLGLQLQVDVGSLDRFKVQYTDPGDQLREVIKTWLTTSKNPTWGVIVEALKSPIIEESRLAIKVQQKYCSNSQLPVDGEWFYVILKSQFIGVGRELLCLNVFLCSILYVQEVYVLQVLIHSHKPRMLVHDDNADDLSKNISP